MAFYNVITATDYVGGAKKDLAMGWTKKQPLQIADLQAITMAASISGLYPDKYHWLS